MTTKTKPLLCYITDRRALPGGTARVLLEVIRRAIAAGVDWIQIREKDLPARDLLALAESAVAAAENSATKILVNDRLDVAVAAGAAGVHLGGESLPAAEVRQWCRGRAEETVPELGQVVVRPDFLVGASCHSLEAALAAERDAADYVIFGPVFATPSKLAFGPPQGLGKLKEVCRRTRIPVLAIGGVTAMNAADCLRAGAAGVAAIRLWQEASDLASVVRGLRISD